MRRIQKSITAGTLGLALCASVAAQAVTLKITNVRVVGGCVQLSIQSDVGITNQIQCNTSLTPTNWVVLTNVLVAQSPYSFEDVSGLSVPAKFYRVLALNTTTVPTGMVWIPPGTFVMGSPIGEASRYSDETQHTVTLTQGFYIGKYAVTQAEYQSLIGSNPSWFSPTYGYPQNLSRPVEQVSWSDATNYCARLTQAEQAAGRLPTGWVYRLPTESEREYACRAGTTTAFHYGSSLLSGMANFRGLEEYDATVGDIANANGIYLNYTTAVGSYQPNAWGLYDMHGNVWEWCRDWYGDYPTGSVIDPQGPASGDGHVFRGGCWFYDGRYCRSAYRNRNYPGPRPNFFGIRVVLAPGQP